MSDVADDLLFAVLAAFHVEIIFGSINGKPSLVPFTLARRKGQWSEYCFQTANKKTPLCKGRSYNLVSNCFLFRPFCDGVQHQPDLLTLSQTARLLPEQELLLFRN